MTRRDITPEAVALRWLAGESILALADAYGVSAGLIERRLTKARETLPDLPWGDRTPTPADSPTTPYATLNDGRPGQQHHRPGSTVPNRQRRKRG
jgi:hypothetical protein